MWNIIIGIIFIIGGLSGNLVLRGTNSSEAITVVGFGLVIWGIFQLARKKPEEEIIAGLPNKSNHKLNVELSKKPEVIAFFKLSLESWQSGKLDQLNLTFKNGSRNMSYESFNKTYGPFEGSALEKFFTIYSPLADEFLIGFGDSNAGNDGGWYVITNHTLTIKDGVSLNYQIIKLSDIESYQLAENITLPCIFHLKDGSSIEIQKVEKHPSKKYMDFALDLTKQTHQHQYEYVS